MATPKFGDVYFADLKAEGCVQGGMRPVIIAQNNIGNAHSPIVEIVPLTSKRKSNYLPTHTVIEASDSNGLRVTSVAMAEQVRVIPIEWLKRRLGSLTKAELIRVGRARNIQSPFPVGSE